MRSLIAVLISRFVGGARVPALSILRVPESRKPQLPKEHQRRCGQQMRTRFIRCAVWFSSCNCTSTFERRVREQRLVVQERDTDHDIAAARAYLSRSGTPYRSESMTLVHWCLSVLNGWRMLRALLHSRTSLRQVDAALGLPLRRMSGDELNATIRNFARFAWLHGLAPEDIAKTIETVRKAHAYAHRQQSAAPR